MARYINVDKLIKEVLASWDKDKHVTLEASRVHRQEHHHLMSIIEKQPTADVVPKSEVIPCKIGDTVWGITKYSGGLTRKARKGTVSAMFFLDDMRLCIVARSISRGEWGKEIFATQEEAEAAIERCGQ